jgi:hypothetical protein
VPPLGTGRTPVTFCVRSIVPLVISAFDSNPVESTPRALLCTSPALVKPGSVMVFAVPPIVTPPVDVPVLILVALFDPAFRLIAPPDIVVAPVIVAPDDPVSNPAEVIVPVPVVDILPLVVTASPDVVGLRTVPRRLQ